MKRIALLLLVAAASLTGVRAQEGVEKLGVFNNLSVGVGLGTTGISLDVATPVTPYVALRGGVDLFGRVKVKTDLKISGTPALYTGPNSFDVEGKTALTAGHLLADVYPFKKSAFHLTVGAYFGKSKIVTVKNSQEGVLSQVSEYNRMFPDNKIGLAMGDFLLTPDEQGNVDATLKVASFRPYLGFGFGRSVPAKHRFALNFDMGVQLWGSPEVYLRDTKLTKDTNLGGEGDFLKTVSKITVWPVLNLRLVGRIL
jgi:hypothetical protein